MLVIGVAGTELTAQERDWLQHDACAGVILFSRNFASKTQVAELSQAIREAAPRPQLICVDQEGGRVQRFRDGYSALPPLEGFGKLVRAGPRRRAEAGRRTRLAHGQRSAGDRRRPQFRAGGRPGPRQSRHRQPRVLRRPASRRRVHPRLRPRHARRGHGRDAQAFPRPWLGAGGHAFRRRGRSAFARGDPRARPGALRRRHRGQGRRGDDGARDVSGRGAGTGGLLEASGSRTSCAGNWVSAAWCSATTSAWPRPTPPVASRRASKRTWMPAAT